MWEEYANAFRVARILEECVRSLNWTPGSDTITQAHLDALRYPTSTMWCVRMKPEMIARKEGLTIYRE